MAPEIVQASDSAIARAARLLRDGELVAFPTETVYGLGGDATSDRAVARIFAAKGRPRFNPLILHVPGLAEAEPLGEFDARGGETGRGPLGQPLRPGQSDHGGACRRRAGRARRADPRWRAVSGRSGV